VEDTRIDENIQVPARSCPHNNLITGLKVVPHKSASVDGKSKPRLDDVIYVRKVDNRAYKRIREWLDEGYEYEDILVLVPSLKKAPWPLSNYNTFWDVKRYLRINQILTIRSQAMIHLKGKIVSARIHACKGLESPCVLAISFDSAAKWLHNGYDDFDLAPPYHVAMTRCKERLTLLQHHESPDLSFPERRFGTHGRNIQLESYDADHIETPSSIGHRRDQVHRHAHVDVIQEAVDILDVQNSNTPVL
jgi:superfamily I DNA and RNA helicase